MQDDFLNYPPDYTVWRKANGNFRHVYQLLRGNFFNGSAEGVPMKAKQLYGKTKGCLRTGKYSEDVTRITLNHENKRVILHVD